MTETQSTICAWAREVFGAPPTPLTIATRANEEVAELLSAVCADQNATEEAADVYIVFCQAAEMLKCHMPTTSKFRPYAGEGRDRCIDFALLVQHYSLRAMEAITKGQSAFLWAHLKSMAECLAEICRRYQTTLQDEVNKKMRINRARKWACRGPGIGQHQTTAYDEEMCGLGASGLCGSGEEDL